MMWWTSGNRWPSRGPISRKSLGGSGIVVLVHRDGAVIRPERGVPGDLDGVFHALVGGAALDVHGQRPLGGLDGLGRDRHVVVHVDRADADRLADTPDPSVDGRGEGVTVELDFAPCQGAS